MKSLSPTNIKVKLNSILEEPARSLTIVKYWVAELKQGRTSCQDEHDNGPPNEVNTTEIEMKIHEMVLDERLLEVGKVFDMVGISKIVVHPILVENINMR